MRQEYGSGASIDGMTAQVHEATDSQVAENVATTLHRAQIKQQQLAHAIGMTGATLSRRMSGQQPWLLWEVQAVAQYFGLTLAEITEALPSRVEWEGRWYAIRDSNPEPADMSFAPVLSIVARIQAGEWPDEPAAPEGRWLRAV